MVKLNPNGRVPVLVHLAERAQLRVGSKFVDEYFCPAVKTARSLPNKVPEVLRTFGG